MDQSIDIEKTASSAAVRSGSPDRIAPPLSPPLAGTTQGDSQPRERLNSPETEHDPNDLSKLYPKLWMEFEASVVTNMGYVSIDGIDIVDTFLLRNFVEARAKIMQHEIHFRRGGSPKGCKVSVDPAAVEDDVNRHSRALQAFDSYRKFYGAFGKVLLRLDEAALARLAAERATLAEHEHQAITDGDTNRQHFLLEMRSRLVDNEQRRLSELHGKAFSTGWLFGRVEERSAFESRLKMAIFGGLVLLVPMIIMVLHATKLTALLTTVSCVLAVAVALSFNMRNAEGKDVLGATAAYAAVLVVFVGTSTTTSELSNGFIGAITGAVCGGCLFIFAIWYYRQVIWRLLWRVCL